MTLRSMAGDKAAHFEAVARTFGERFKQRRVAEGLFEDQVAEKTGLPLPLVLMVERGTADPTLEEMVTLADAVGVDIWDLFVSS